MRGMPRAEGDVDAETAVLRPGQLVAVVAENNEYWLAEVRGNGGAATPSIRWLDKCPSDPDKYEWCVGSEPLNRGTLIDIEVAFDRRRMRLLPGEAERLQRLRDAICTVPQEKESEAEVEEEPAGRGSKKGKRAESPPPRSRSSSPPPSPAKKQPPRARGAKRTRRGKRVASPPHSDRSPSPPPSPRVTHTVSAAGAGTSRKDARTASPPAPHSNSAPPSPLQKSGDPEATPREKGQEDNGQLEGKGKPVKRRRGEANGNGRRAKPRKTAGNEEKVAKDKGKNSETKEPRKGRQKEHPAVPTKRPRLSASRVNIVEDDDESSEQPAQVSTALPASCVLMVAACVCSVRSCENAKLALERNLFPPACSVVAAAACVAHSAAGLTPTLLRGTQPCNVEDECPPTPAFDMQAVCATPRFVDESRDALTPTDTPHHRGDNVLRAHDVALLKDDVIPVKERIEMYLKSLKECSFEPIPNCFWTRATLDEQRTSSSPRARSRGADRPQKTEPESGQDLECMPCIAEPSKELWVAGTDGTDKQVLQLLRRTMRSMARGTYHVCGFLEGVVSAERGLGYLARYHHEFPLAGLRAIASALLNDDASGGGPKVVIPYLTNFPSFEASHRIAAREGRQDGNTVIICGLPSEKATPWSLARDAWAHGRLASIVVNFHEKECTALLSYYSKDDARAAYRAFRHTLWDYKVEDKVWLGATVPNDLPSAEELGILLSSLERAKGRAKAPEIVPCPPPRSTPAIPINLLPVAVAIPFPVDAGNAPPALPVGPVMAQRPPLIPSPHQGPVAMPPLPSTSLPPPASPPEASPIQEAEGDGPPAPDTPQPYNPTTPKASPKLTHPVSKPHAKKAPASPQPHTQPSPPPQQREQSDGEGAEDGVPKGLVLRPPVRRGTAPSPAVKKKEREGERTEEEEEDPTHDSEHYMPCIKNRGGDVDDHRSRLARLFGSICH